MLASERSKVSDSKVTQVRDKVHSVVIGGFLDDFFVVFVFCPLFPWLQAGRRLMFRYSMMNEWMIEAVVVAVVQSLMSGWIDWWMKESAIRERRLNFGSFHWKLSMFWIRHLKSRITEDPELSNGESVHTMCMMGWIHYKHKQWHKIEQKLHSKRATMPKVRKTRTTKWSTFEHKSGTTSHPLTC